MFDEHRRPVGRLFYLLAFLVLALTASPGQPPVTTTISEVRWTDFGWGPANDRNLAGRFSTQTFTLPRLAAVQDYFLRQYDNAMPPRYSRYTTALHLKYPL
jgi:hypothetical protein